MEIIDYLSMPDSKKNPFPLLEVPRTGFVRGLLLDRRNPSVRGYIHEGGLYELLRGIEPAKEYLLSILDKTQRSLARHQFIIAGVWAEVCI